MKIVIVGSGVVGSVVAESILSAGLGTVTMLEAGPEIPMANAADWFNLVTGSPAPYEKCYDQTGDYASVADTPQDKWQITGGRVLGRGGSTLHWGGWVPRFMPEDFQYHTNTGQGLDWPYGYIALEPYYCAAETFLGVSGDSSDQNPPRSQNYPYSAAPYPLMMQPIMTAMEALGMTYAHMPVSRYGKGATDRTPCRTTGTCKYCPISARYTGDQSLDSLSAQSDFSLILNAPAKEITMSDRNTVSGVTYVDTTTGQSTTLEADYVFVCAGALETPKLLQNSTSTWWPSGVGNDHDLVGRYLMASPYFFAMGTIAQNPQKIQSELGFPTLSSRYYDTEEYQKKGGKFYFNTDYAHPNLKISDLMAHGQTTAQIQTAATGAMQFQIQGTMAAIPNYDNRVSSEAGTTRFGLPKTYIDTPVPLYDEAQSKVYLQAMENILEKIGCTGVSSGGYPQRGDHAMGTCRMAACADQGVVDENWKVFDMNNLYVMGNATFPSMGAANPTLTLVAATFKAMNTFLSEKK
jgi:choline dehydrogenase-like flavoprotein